MLKITMDEYINRGFLSREMADLLNAILISKTSVLCTGASGSGKKTLLNTLIEEEEAISLKRKKELNLEEIKMILQTRLPRNSIIIKECREDDLEAISLKRKKELNLEEIKMILQTRLPHNSIIIKECREDDLEDIKSNFLIKESLMSKTDIEIIKECETYEEYSKIFDIIIDVEEQLSIIADMLSLKKGLPYEKGLKIVSDSLDFIISLKRYSTNEYKIKTIIESCGVDKYGNIKLNKLFEYKVEGLDVDKETGVKKLKGKFIQTGNLSAKMQMRFMEYGVSKEIINEFNK